MVSVGQTQSPPVQGLGIPTADPPLTGFRPFRKVLGYHQVRLGQRYARHRRPNPKKTCHPLQIFGTATLQPPCVEAVLSSVWTPSRSTDSDVHMLDHLCITLIGRGATLVVHDYSQPRLASQSPCPCISMHLLHPDGPLGTSCISHIALIPTSHPQVLRPVP